MPKVKNIQTGEIQDVTEDQLGVTLASGDFEPEQGSRVAVVNEFGELGTIDAADISSGAAEQSGYRIATPQEIAEQRNRQEYGEGLATVQAGAEGIARGATVGLSDLLLTSLGVSAEGLRERKEQNPIASGGGEAVGILGSVLLSGGAGAAEQAAGRGALATAGRMGLGAARLSPAGLIARGGVAAERELASILGTRALGKAATAGIVGAGEGALYGAGEAVSEAALGDHELTAERVLASAGRGAIWGGAGGAGMSLLGSGIGAAARKVKKVPVQDDAALAGAFGVPKKNVDLTISAKISSARKVVDDLNITTESKSLIKKYIDKADDIVRGRKALRGLDDTLDNATEDVTRYVTRMEEIRDDVMYNDLVIANKIKTMAQVVKADKNVDTAALGKHIEDSITRTRNKYIEVVEDPSGFGYDPYEISVMKRKKPVIDQQLFRIKKLNREGLIDDNIEEMLGIWDQSKRELGRIDKQLEEAGFGTRILAKDLKQYYMNDLREELMDKNLLGKAADIQSAWNKAFEQDLDVKHVYDRYFLTDAGGKKKSGGFGNVKVGDMNKIRSAIRGSNQDLNLYNTIMRRSAKNQADLLETLSAYNAFVDPKTINMASEARDISNKLLASMDASSAAVSQSNIYKRALEEASDVPMAAQILKTLATVADRGGDMLKNVGDKLFEGKITGWIHNASGAESNKKTIIKSINQRASSVANTTRTAVDSFFKRGKRAIVPLAITQYDKDETLNERYQKTIKRHDSILDNQGMLVERAAKMIDSDVAPSTSIALTASTIRAASFLKSKQPTPNTRSSDVFAHLSDRQRVADSEIAKYMRYVDGVESPIDSIKAFGETGDMSRETAEAIRTVYPKLFAEFETKITNKLVDAKEPLPYGDLMRLSLILNRPLHPSLEGSYIAACQAVHQSRPSETATPSRQSMPNTSENYLSPSEKLA